MFVEFNRLPGLKVKLSLIVRLSLIIYILHKQNIKSCNAKRQQNKKIDLISKETTLCAQHTSFVHFFAVILHDYDAKLPETS